MLLTLDRNRLHGVFAQVRSAIFVWTRRRIGLAAMIGGLAATGISPSAEPNELPRLMNTGGHVLLVRHADAPGTGDPPGLRLGDCSTQRNLGEEGRVQARAMGAWLRNNGIDSASLYSSEWCRCLETAELMGLGPVTPLPALNSFYERPEDREANLTRLKEFLAAPPLPRDPLILVTHQVTISALTGEFVSSGRGVLARVDASGDLTTVRQVDFGQ